MSKNGGIIGYQIISISGFYAHATAFLLRGSDRFIAAGCVPKVRLNSVSQSDYR